MTMTRALIAGFFAVGLIVSTMSGRAEATDTVPPLPEQSPVAAEKVAALIASFGAPALEYLEDTEGKSASYVPPSQIDPRYTIALYVNADGSGDHAQRMWVLHRSEIGGPWRLAMWDERYWRRKGLPSSLTPPYSWLVSTGRHYRGDRRSGPTPKGVFALDERRWRMARGQTSPGMIHVMYIDLHYSGGRRSGVAFHGTTHSRYRRLGRIDSHGCIRMTQANALALLQRIRGRDGVLSDEMRYGDVPRFWRYQRGGNRYGYTRDGTMHPVEVQVAEETLRPGMDPTATDADSGPQYPSVLTKEGYRAIAVIFGSGS